MSPSSKEKLNADLLEAAKNGQTGKVLSLIKTGADVSAKDNFGKTALMWTGANGHIKTANLIRAAGAKDNT